ncbi:MAG: Ig-like domain-containing protein [Fidelibacterota bacterium]
MKRALCVFSLLVLGLAASILPAKIQFFLTELDFISNQPVPESEIQFKPHLRVDYDDANNVIQKLHLNKQGKVTKTEIFTYDSTQILKTKDIYVPEEILVQKIMFGLEEKAVDYIEYVYGVDTVKDWADRFSIMDYNHLSQLTNHSFYDVNAFMYGNAHFEYDSLGHLSKEEWIRHPSKKTMYLWNHFFDPVTQLTRIMEYDSNGVLVQDFRLNPDGSESIFWFKNLEDSTFINHTKLVFWNESFLEWGRVVFFKVNSDSTQHDSVQYTLQKQYLNEGNFSVEMELDSLLQDSAMYNIVFKGWGKSGYKATERGIYGVIYDISSPILELNIKPFINKPFIAYDHSEPLTKASLEWITMHDSTQILSIEFDSLDLTKSGNGKFRLAHQEELTDSVFYRVTLSGVDRAGNISTPTELDSIMYDIQRPILELSSPVVGEHRNISSIAFANNEPIISWKIMVKSMLGVPDSLSPHYYETDSSFFDPGIIEKDLSDEFKLSDGTVYRFELSGIDRAGNISTIHSVDSVTYDITPPILTIIYPASGAVVNQATISYSNNEKLRAGEFRWEQTEGTMDSSAPHIIPLIQSELEKGDHIQYRLSNQEELNDGTVYSLMFVGQDFAGNEGIAPSHADILFDAVPPEFSDIKPLSGSALNYKHVSYTLSEKIESGSITWIWLGGIKDESSPHIMSFVGDEMEIGVHDSIMLEMDPPLADGGEYQLELNAIDFAGNVAETKVVNNILYDFTPPQITVSYPMEMSFLPKTTMTYFLSESLKNGSFLLERISGKEDPKSPYEIDLSINEKLAGEHNDVHLIFMPKVIEGTVYKLSFNGYDRANNYTSPLVLSGLQYDFTPPIISIIDPMDNTDVNHLRINYEFSELMKEAEVSWEWTGGVNDPNPIHGQSLVSDELAEGIHQGTELLNSPNLIDGGIYNISISAKDRAGNSSNIPSVSQIRYDITAPVIVLNYPSEGSYVSTPVISYELSENLDSGKIIFTQTGGSLDTLSPQEFVMSFELMEKGEHSNIFKLDGPELTEGSIYTISIEGNDRAGNEASIASVSGIIYDATPPIISLHTADSSLFVNHNRISFSKSEPIKRGVITWKQIGGTNDPASPLVIDLTDDELSKDSYDNYTLMNAPHLNDGSIYTIEFTAVDFAGNISETAQMENVLYDISPPVLQIVSPGNNYITNGTELSVSISEDLSNGKITWDGIDSEGNSQLTSWELKEGILNGGQYDVNDYYIPDLIDGGIYSITFNAQDPAGNESIPVKIDNYRVDRTPPVFTNMKPVTGSFINRDFVGYTLSEDMQKGVILMESKNGTISVPLQGQELKSGEHPLDQLLAKPNWTDGENYHLEFVGSDFAENVSDTVYLNDIYYDISPPIFTLTNPGSDDYINETIVTFSVNESLANGQMIWVSDTGDSLVIELAESRLLKGDHVINDSIDFVEKIPYSIFFRGIDLAGNHGSSDPISNVRFDITKPELKIISPEENSIVNHLLVSYHLNEDLQSSKLFWQDVSGMDNNSVHEIALTGDEMIAGDHIDITLNKLPELLDGASYMIQMEGSDLAGNKNIAEPIKSYTLDFSPPVFSKIKPPSGALINQVELEYTISENLKSGTITFVRTDGEPDQKSPHIVKLSGKKLNKGTRGGVLPSNLVPLTNGSVYKIEFSGIDSAGNTSEDMAVENISFDNELPVVFIKAPQHNVTINNLACDYIIGEDMVSGQLIVEIDSKNKLVIELKEDEMKAGEYAQFLPPELAELDDGVTLNFTLVGSDAAGNIAKPHSIENVKYDTTHPVVTIVDPSTDDIINYTTISINISEDLAVGNLTIIQTGGVVDSRSPITIPLQTTEMKSGSYEFIQLEYGPKFQNGSIYTYEFSGEDFAGNPVLSQSVINILYDNEPPVISISKPIDSEHIKNTEVSFISSDQLSRGLVTFERTGGSTDSKSPHVIELEGTQLREGIHMDENITIPNALADGSIYLISIQGWDNAGNESKIVSVKSVLFDVLPPTLTIHSPINGDAFNNPVISFEMNEKLAEGTFTFKQTSGTIDPDSPHIVNILPPYDVQGRYNDINYSSDLTLNDGSIYSITFNASDPAGNVSDPFTVSDIIYDNTPPKISITSPVENSHLRNITVTFSNDETLISGALNVEQTLGTADPNSPHKIDLMNEYLLPGEHSLTVQKMTQLINDAEYRIKINGMDKAGNETVSNIVGQLVYDIEPPVLQLTEPLAHSIVNHSIIGFILNEPLQSLSIAWVDDAGTIIQKMLPEKYRLPEKYERIVLGDSPALISGTMYTLQLEGTDLAGNESAIKIEEVKFDNEPPVFTAISPSENSYVNHTNVHFDFNEPLQSGELIWTATGGATDSQSPRKITLSQPELEQPFSAPATLNNQNPLNDGTIYQLSIRGMDIPGNETEVKLTENIHYDISQPTLTLLSPENNDYINDDDVEFSLNENLLNAVISWTRVGGEADPLSHKITLSDDLLTAGEHSTAALSDLPLVSGAIYKIEISGTDLAGNQSESVGSVQVNYDTTPPVVSITLPTVNSQINILNISYTLSEPLKSGEIIYTNENNSTIGKTQLSPNELTSLNWDNNVLENPLNLEDGGTYTLILHGIDLAGNMGESEKITGVRYDISKPEFTILRPKENYVNVESITHYTINEDIVSGTATWVRTGGKILGPVATANRPQVMELVGDELKGGDHKNILFTNSPKLNATTIYKLTLIGTDAAGNESLPTSVDGIEFIPNLAGNWYFQGAIMTVVWTFEPDEGVEDQSTGIFSQGMQMGTKISNQEYGNYTIDYSVTPWEMVWVMEKSGQQRFSIFEFRDNLHLKVLTKDRKKPKNWRDGEVMIYEFR